MTRYSVQPRDRIFVKAYGFLSFAKNMGKNIGKNISKKLSSKYCQKLLDHAKKSATDAVKTASKRAIQKTADATGDLIGNKIADKITKLSKILPQNNSGTNEEEKILVDMYMYLRWRYISLEQRHKIIDGLRLIYYNITMRYQKIMNLLDDSIKMSHLNLEQEIRLK